MDLRQKYRTMRRSLSPQQKTGAAHQLLSHFLEIPFLRTFTHIAVYMAFEGEIDPVFIQKWCLKNNKKLYLPKIYLYKKNINLLHFVKYTEDDKLIINKFNILEPSAQEAIDLEQLDLILLPLVAFDRKGRRLGMGKGYYDATLKDVKHPYLLGLGYDFQCVDNIIPHDNDVQLDGIITDKELILLEK